MRLSAVVYLIKRSTINFICLCFDTICFYAKPKDFISLPKKSILIIRPDAIGDFIVWSDSAKAYRKIYPDAHLIMLGNVACHQLAMEMSLFDEVWSIDRKQLMLNLFYRYRTFKKLRSFSFDTIIYPAYSREFGSIDLLIRKIVCSQKIGIRSDFAIDHACWINLGNKWYTNLLNIESGTHELTKNAAFINAMGYSDFKPSLPSITVKSAAHSPIKDPYYILFPGARVGLRKWEPEKFSLIGEQIFNKTGWKGIVCGSANESELAEIIIKKTTAPITNMAGSTKLLELMALISNAKILVGNETSCVHIATAVKTPSICITGGGHFGRFVPYPQELETSYTTKSVFYSMPCFNCDWNCIYKVSKQARVPCIEQVSVAQVWSKVEKMIDRMDLDHN